MVDGGDGIAVMQAHRPLSSESRRHAEEALNEPTGEARAAALAKFTDEVTDAVGAEAARQFEWAILATLRQSKWDGEGALRRMKALCEFARRHAEYFEAADAEQFRAIAAIGLTSHLPTRTAKNELVMLIDGQKLRAFATAYTMRDMLRYSVFYMSLLLADETTQVHGAIILENLQDYPIFALNTMKGMGPSGMRASFEWLGASPLRLRGLYACKQPWYVAVMLALVKPFMSRKLKERTHLYGEDTATMLAEAGLQPEQVPPEYGGTLQGFDPAWFIARAEK